MIEHTPTPWAADPDDREGYEWNIHIVTESNRDMRVAFMTSGPEAAANADFIVKAVNCHDALVVALLRVKDIAAPTTQRPCNDILDDITAAVDAAFNKVPHD